MNCRHSLFFVAFSFFLCKNSSAQQDPYHPLRISRNIVLDGTLRDSLWSHAGMVNDFMQTDPSPGAPSTEKTEARILYNNEFLYVGIRCYDSLPQKIIRLGLERDYNLGEDDGTSFLIDTYHDKTSATVFATNTLNARWDTQISNDGLNENDSYNTFWDVNTNMDSAGYTTVYRIPFSSLRFETKPEITMGFRVARLVKRKSELSTFPRMNPETLNGWINVSFARDIVFDSLKSRKPFYIIPYAIANFYESNVLNSEGTAYENQRVFLVRKNFVSNEALDKIMSNIGADAKYGLTKNLTLDLTLNTDFAQAEVDDRIINLTKYDVNLPEKRNFFLESSNNLSYGFPAGNEIFITRSIGNENGVVVPIIAGARITGKTHGWQLGTLDMQTKGIADAGIEPHNFFVFRTRKDIDKLGSFVGGIFTNRLNTDSSHLSNQSIGFDFVKRINQQVAFEGGIAGTLINFNMKSLPTKLYYSGGIFRNTNEGLYYQSTIDLIGENFVPVMGYIDENNYGLVTGGIGYQWKANPKSAAEYFFISNNNNYRWRQSTARSETFYTELFPGVIFKSGAVINFSLFQYKIDTLFENWYLDDKNAVQAGTYRMFYNSIDLTAPTKSNYSASLSASYGGFYGGQRIFISPDITYNFNRHFNVGITYEYNHILFPAYLDESRTTLYQTNLIRFSFSYLISTKFSFKLYTQYDDLGHEVSTNLRFRYNPEEGTDLYVVLNQGLNTNRTELDPHLPLLNTQAVTIKFIKTFEL